MAALGAVLWTSGCDIGGLVDIGDGLLDPDSALLDRPGRQLVSGSYSGLKIAGSAEGGGYVLARREDADDERVAVVPFLKGEPCEYAPAFDYDRFSSRIDLELPGTLSIQADRDESNPAFGTVRFIDYSCREVIDELPSTVLPGPIFPGIDPFGMLARDSAGTLHLIDAKKRTRVVVAEDVDYGVVTGSFLYTLEAGEVVIRDDSLDVVDRVGTGVFNVVATGGTRMPLVYEDEGGIHGFSEEDGVRTLAEDGCRLWPLALDSVAYFEPCDERRLTLVLPTEAVFDTPDVDTFVVLRGPSNAIMDSVTLHPSPSSTSAQLTDIAVVTQPSTGVPTGTLQVLTLPDDAESDAEELDLDAREMREGVTYIAGDGMYYQDYADGRGTLLDFVRDDDGLVTGVVEIAENVAWVPFANPYSYRGILADYDGQGGRLLRIARDAEDGLSRIVLGENVPEQTFIGDPETSLVAYVSDVDEQGLGILTIVDELGPLEVAEDVLINESKLLDDPHGVVFLQPGEDDGTFELHAWLVEAEIDLLVHAAASEYLAIPWPSPGVLYSVPHGDDAGLWFAKAR